jgi:hypothetical protein
LIQHLHQFVVVHVVKLDVWMWIWITRNCVNN